MAINIDQGFTWYAHRLTAQPATICVSCAVVMSMETILGTL